MDRQDMSRYPFTRLQSDIAKVQQTRQTCFRLARRLAHEAVQRGLGVEIVPKASDTPAQRRRVLAPRRSVVGLPGEPKAAGSSSSSSISSTFIRC